MIGSDEWFENEGKAHLRRFFGMIESAYRKGKMEGLKITKIDIDEIFRAYLNQDCRVTEEMADAALKLKSEGMKIRHIARGMRVNEASLIKKMKRCTR